MRCEKQAKGACQIQVQASSEDTRCEGKQVQGVKQVGGGRWRRSLLRCCWY